MPPLKTIEGLQRSQWVHGRPRYAFIDRAGRNVVSALDEVALQHAKSFRVVIELPLDSTEIALDEKARNRMFASGTGLTDTLRDGCDHAR